MKPCLHAAIARALLSPAAIVLAAAAIAARSAAAEPVIDLWPLDAHAAIAASGAETVRVTPEGEHVVSDIHRPTLSVFLPAQVSGATTAVLVIPGGGHREIWIDHEGYNVARRLNEGGIAAFVLKYRLTRQAGSSYTIEGESLADVQRALRIIRHRAAEWRVNPARVGVMGFSAGGELAALAGVRAATGDAAAAAAIDRESARPDFQALIYPGNPAVIAPGASAPPAFLVCGENDRAEIANGLAAAYLRCREAGVSVELHVIAGAGHGFGVRASNRGLTAHWLDLFAEWLAALPPPPAAAP